MTITIQRRSKPIKALILFASLVQLFGLIMIFGSEPGAGVTTIIVGIALNVFGRILEWWFHD